MQGHAEYRNKHDDRSKALPAQFEEGHRPGEDEDGFQVKDHEEDGDQVKLDRHMNLRRAHRQYAGFEGHVGGLVGPALAEHKGQPEHGCHQQQYRDEVNHEGPQGCRRLAQMAVPRGG